MPQSDPRFAETPINAHWSGSCPDPGHPDYRWELDIELDDEGLPLIGVSALSVNNDHYGLACLTPRQARQAARVLLAAADRVEADE